MRIGTKQMKRTVYEISRLVKSHERICEISQVYAKAVVTKWDERKGNSWKENVGLAEFLNPPRIHA